MQHVVRSELSAHSLFIAESAKGQYAPYERHEMKDYTARVDRWLSGWLPKEGFRLISSEFVNESGNCFLRAYIDLTEEEYEKRLAQMKEEEAAAKAPEEGEDAENSARAPEEEAAGPEEELLPGIGINDCVKVSRKLSAWLDKEDFIKEAYTLEVCSKGFLET